MCLETDCALICLDRPDCYLHPGCGQSGDALLYGKVHSQRTGQPA
jgi:hypothetical protein